MEHKKYYEDGYWYKQDKIGYEGTAEYFYISLQRLFDMYLGGQLAEQMRLLDTISGRVSFVTGYVKEKIGLDIREHFVSKSLPDNLGFASRMDGVCWGYLIGLNLSGVFALFINGYDKCFLIDSRTYPARSVSEPEKDKALRGSKDGVVETVVFNMALIRRRIRRMDLRVEMFRRWKAPQYVKHACERYGCLCTGGILLRRSSFSLWQFSPIYRIGEKLCLSIRLYPFIRNKCYAA